MKKILALLMTLFMMVSVQAQIPQNGDTTQVQIHLGIILPGSVGHGGHAPVRPVIVYGTLYNGVLTFNATDFDSSSIEIEVVDADTETTMLTDTISATAGQFVIDLTSFPHGIYYLYIRLENDDLYEGEFEL